MSSRIGCQAEGGNGAVEGFKGRAGKKRGERDRTGQTLLI